MSRLPTTDELESLEARLAEARARHAPAEPLQVAGSALAQGFRFAVEIVGGAFVGGFIGWKLDQWLGTKPWLSLVFLLLGLAAGFMNLLRVVNREQRAVNAEPMPPAAPPESEGQ
ncbi:MAG: AtpZ/AtpI family protein [Janthinobacterium lividum]